MSAKLCLCFVEYEIAFHVARQPERCLCVYGHSRISWMTSCKDPEVGSLQENASKVHAILELRVKTGRAFEGGKGSG
jgi:hypothetical protein